MDRRIANCCLVGGLLLAVMGVARGEDSATKSDDLLVGDWYTIDSQRDEVHEKFSGRLIKTNDTWLVLHRRITTRQNVKRSALSHLPLVGQFFGGSNVQGYNEFLWIPRDAATIVDHKPDTTAKRPPEIDEDIPRTGDSSQIVVAVAEHTDWKVARVYGLQDRHLVLANERVPLQSVLAVRIGTRL